MEYNRLNFINVLDPVERTRLANRLISITDFYIGIIELDADSPEVAEYSSIIANAGMSIINESLDILFDESRTGSDTYRLLESFLPVN